MALRRARVGSVIEAALNEGAVTLLIAPPGYGKTIALRDTIGGNPSFRWIDLPAGARLEDLVRLITAAAIPSDLGSLGALFDGTGAPKDTAMVLEWTARRLRRFEGTIVIDDLHRALGDGDVTTFLARLIEATATYVRWVAASREMPALPIGTWVARGLMALPVTGDDLAFTLDEAAALAALRGVSIEREVLASVIDDTGGWPIAVHLALGLWDRTRSIAPLHIRTRELLFSQIEHEVWPSVPDDLRDVIIASALLPEATSAVLEAAGFSDAQFRLERAHRAVPFVQRTVDGFTLHDVFADFVLTTLRREPGMLADLRWRLGHGLRTAGRLVDALGVFIASDDTGSALDVLAECGVTLLDGGHRGSVSRTLAALAERGLGNHPVVAALRGILCYIDGNTNNAEALMRYGVEHALPPAMHVEVARRLATAYMNRGAGDAAIDVLLPLIEAGTASGDALLELHASLGGSFATAGRPSDAAAAIETTLAGIHAASPPARARILQRLGVTAYYIGDLDRAAAFARDSAQLATGLNLWSIAAMAHSILYSVSSLTESDARLSLEEARLIAAAAERAGDTGMLAFGLRAEYLLYAFGGDDEAFDALEARIARLHDVRTFRLPFVSRFARAVVDAYRGKIPRAISSLAGINVRDLAGSERAQRDGLLALLLAVDGRNEESLAILKVPLLVEVRDDFASRRSMLLARVTRGIALWCHDRTAQTRRMFDFDREVVAENDRVLVQCVVEICSRPRHLANATAVAGPLGRLRNNGWGGFARLIESILAKVDPAANLTPAEIKTLRAFQNGANTVQVASILGKSPHTIEAQLKSAYKKIGCVSRAEALVYARSRGWLDEQRLGIPESC